MTSPIPPTSPQASEVLAARYSRSIAEFIARSRAAQWNLPDAALVEVVYRSLRASIPDAAGAELEAYLASLHAEDLALACACRLGIEAAWERFITEYRPVLYAAARALTHDAILSRDLADSTYAELYGLEVRDGERRSLLDYFHGRSSLKTWLRAVLAQRYVDSWRASRRAAPLDEAAPSLAADQPPDPGRARYLAALDESLRAAIAALKPRDRLRLSYYYLEELTLKQIGSLMGEHESTVSRRLAGSRRQLKRAVERTLRRRMRFSDEQIRLCYDYSAEVWPFDLRPALAGTEPAAKVASDAK